MTMITYTDCDISLGVGNMQHPMFLLSLHRNVIFLYTKYVPISEQLPMPLIYQCTLLPISYWACVHMVSA